MKHTPTLFNMFKREVITRPRQGSFAQAYLNKYPHEMSLNVIEQYHMNSASNEYICSVSTISEKEENFRHEEPDCLLSVHSEKGSQTVLCPEIKQSDTSVRVYCIYFVDIFVSLLVFSPLVAFYWYGTWTFLDLYIIPDNKTLSYVVCWVGGLLVLLPFYMLGAKIFELYSYLKTVRPVLGKTCRLLMRVLFIYVNGLAIVVQWRGLWNMFDLFANNDSGPQIALSVVATLYFCCCRSTSSLVVTPFGLYADNFDGFFDIKESRNRIKSVFIFLLS